MTSMEYVGQGGMPLARTLRGYPSSESSLVPVGKFSYIWDYYIGSLYVIKLLLELRRLQAILAEAVWSSTSSIRDSWERGQTVSTGEVQAASRSGVPGLPRAGKEQKREIGSCKM